VAGKWESLAFWELSQCHGGGEKEKKKKRKEGESTVGYLTLGLMEKGVMQESRITGGISSLGTLGSGLFGNAKWNSQKLMPILNLGKQTVRKRWRKRLLKSKGSNCR